MSLPRVSIVVPVYNGTNYMRAAIDSALAQDYPDFEVVVVNDGSRDGGATDAVARSYGDRIRYIPKENGGVATALNAGIAAMTGEIFCWLSHDDIHLPHKTRRQAEEWVRRGRPRREVLISDYRVIGPDGAALAENRLDHALLEAKPLYALLRGSIHGCSVFLPRPLFDEVGGFDPALPTTQDYDLWFRMIMAGARFRHMPEVLIESRQHDEQGSKKLDHLVEAEALWRRMVRGVPLAERRALEGSAWRFATETAGFLGRCGLGGLEAALRRDAEEDLAATPVSVALDAGSDPALAAASLASIRRQTHPPAEVLLLGPQAAALAGGDARALPGADWAMARAAAAGRVFAPMRAGDLWHPERLEAQLRFMEEGGHHAALAAHHHAAAAPAALRRGTAPSLSALLLRDDAPGTPTQWLRPGLPLLDRALVVLRGEAPHG